MSNILKTKLHWNWQKIKEMLSKTLRLNFCYLKIIHIFHQGYHPKVIQRIIKNKQKNKCVFIHEIIRLIIMKMQMKMKNRSYKYNINRPNLDIVNIKKCLNIMLLICIKQHLKIMWSSIHEKVRQHWRWIEKCVAYKKRCVLFKAKPFLNKQTLLSLYYSYIHSHINHANVRRATRNRSEQRRCHRIRALW